MSIISLFLGVITILSGCTISLQTPNIDSDQVYLGYPCFDDCENFAAGYQQGLKAGFTKPQDCESLNEVVRVGCSAYVNEYEFVNNPEADLKIRQSR
jgi:hypothetical protein